MNSDPIIFCAWVVVKVPILIEDGAKFFHGINSLSHFPMNRTGGGIFASGNTVVGGHAKKSLRGYCTPGPCF